MEDRVLFFPAKQSFFLPRDCHLGLFDMTVQVNTRRIHFETVACTELRVVWQSKGQSWDDFIGHTGNLSIGIRNPMKRYHAELEKSMIWR